MRQQGDHAAWTTLDDCKRELNTRLEKLFELFCELPDERLSDTKCSRTTADATSSRGMMDYPRELTDPLGHSLTSRTLYGTGDALEGSQVGSVVSGLTTYYLTTYYLLLAICSAIFSTGTLRLGVRVSRPLISGWMYGKLGIAKR